jgi:predicted nucleotidyltransferase
MNELAALGDATRQALDELKAELVRSLGDSLVALAVYGSTARGAYREGESDVDLAIVLSKSSRDRLERISNAVQLARYSARIETMVLEADEIPRAVDVFPIFYDDMKQHHVLLAGKDVFEGLVIKDTHRRLRIEQELRESQIRLRRAVIDSLGSNDALAGVVLRKAKQARFPLHALLRLKKIECPDELAAVLAKAGEVYKVDTAPIRNAREAAPAAHDALVALLAAAIDEVDRMEVA